LIVSEVHCNIAPLVVLLQQLITNNNFLDSLALLLIIS
jgi:hypothetical protein